MGIPHAYFRMSGKTPVEIDRLNRSLMGLLNTWANLTNILWGMALEWPERQFSLLITTSTSLAIDGDAKNEDCTRSPKYERGEVLLNGIWDSKLLPTELKYEKKASAICVESWVVIPLSSISVGDPFSFLLRNVKSFNSFQVFF